MDRPGRNYEWENTSHVTLAGEPPVPPVTLDCRMDVQGAKVAPAANLGTFRPPVYNTGFPQVGWSLFVRS